MNSSTRTSIRYFADVPDADRLDDFLAALAALPAGYREGACEGSRYGVTTTASADGRRRRLYGEELGGADRISCNVYGLAGGRAVLRPCEMPAAKVIAFVLGFRPDDGDASRYQP